MPFFCCFDLYLSYSRGRLKSLGKISLPKGSAVDFAPLFGSTLRINLTLDHSVGECPSPVSRRHLNTIDTSCRFSASVPHNVGRGAICYYAFPCGVTNFPLVSTLFYFVNQLPKRTIVNCRQQLSEGEEQNKPRKYSGYSRGLTNIYGIYNMVIYQCCSPELQCKFTNFRITDQIILPKSFDK